MPSRLKQIQNNLAKAADLHLENKAQGLCVQCGLPALARCYSDAGRREVAITGMCELCFDALYAPEPD